MSFDIPPLHIPDNSREAQVIQAIMIRDQVTAEEAVRAALRGMTIENAESATVLAPRRSYASFFGVVKGPGAHGSREAIDSYVSELRNEW